MRHGRLPKPRSSARAGKWGNVRWFRQSVSISACPWEDDRSVIKCVELYHLVEAIKPASSEHYAQDIIIYEGYAEHLKESVRRASPTQTLRHHRDETGTFRYWLKWLMLRRGGWLKVLYFYSDVRFWIVIGRNYRVDISRTGLYEIICIHACIHVRSSYTGTPESALIFRAEQLTCCAFSLFIFCLQRERRTRGLWGN